MGMKIRVPFFEIGVKNYLYGDDVLALAKAADEAAAENDIDVLFIAPYTEIRRIAEQTDHLILLAPYMDHLYPGRGIAGVLPEAVRAAGARGVVVNHCERPMSLPDIRKTIQRAHELGLFVFACADSLAEARAVACLDPDIINPEPTELIGSGKVSDAGYVSESMRLVHQINPAILVEQAAGITNEAQVRQFICSGAQGVGVASGIVLAKDPCGMARTMIRAVRQAYDTLQKEGNNENPSENINAAVPGGAPVLPFDNRTD